jgi:hypothetical protein
LRPPRRKRFVSEPLKEVEILRAISREWEYQPERASASNSDRTNSAERPNDSQTLTKEYGQERSFEMTQL